jgi:N-acyl-D-aspartate/D-glutamate deacylase
MGDLNAGLFELAGEGVDREPGHPGLREYHERLRDLAVESGRPITFGLFSRRGVPEVWKQYLDLLDETAAAGGRMFAQAHSRSLSALLSFRTQSPFDHLPVWKEIRKLPLAEQAAKYRDPEIRKKVAEASTATDGRRPVGTEARLPNYDWLLLFDTVEGPHRTIAEIARERNQHPALTMVDLAMERNFDCFFLQPVANEDQDIALQIMKHPRTVTTFSDSGKRSGLITTP